MADQVQWRGGTTAEHSVFVGAPRELTVDTDKKTVVVHDGFTAGGHPLLRQDLANLTAAPDAAAARAAIGAGTSNLVLGYSAGQAKPGDWAPTLEQIGGNLPLHKLAPYTAGDNFDAGRFEANVPFDTGDWRFVRIGLRAASYGTVRILVNHTKDLLIKLNYQDVLYWGGLPTNDVEHAGDLYVNYGDVIHILLYGSGAKLNWARIRTADVSPMFISDSPLN